MRKDRKNVSKTVPNGRTLQTRDNFFKGQGGKKTGHENDKGYYRKVVVVDSNINDNFAVVKLTTKGAFKLPSYKNGKSTYDTYILTKDVAGNAIQVGKYFIENKSGADLSKKDVRSIINNCKKHQRNIDRLNELKCLPKKDNRKK